MKKDYYVDTENGDIWSVPKGQGISVFEMIYTFGPFRSKLMAYSRTKRHWLMYQPPDCKEGYQNKVIDKSPRRGIHIYVRG
jgi:hypothetical protein